MSGAPTFLPGSIGQLEKESLALVSACANLAKARAAELSLVQVEFVRDLTLTIAVFGWRGLSVAQIYSAADLLRVYDAKAAA